MSTQQLEPVFKRGRPSFVNIRAENGKEEKVEVYNGSRYNWRFLARFVQNARKRKIPEDKIKAELERAIGTNRVPSWYDEFMASKTTSEFRKNYKTDSDYVGAMQDFRPDLWVKLPETLKHPKPPPAASTKATEKETAALMKKALGIIPPRAKQVLSLLQKNDKMTDAEIAKQLGLKDAEVTELVAWLRTKALLPTKKVIEHKPEDKVTVISRTEVKT